MIARFTLHAGLLLYALLVTQTLSILVFILPVALLTMFGACRNRNENFDTLDMFWLINQLAFVLAPAASFRESENDYLFSSGVIVDYWMGRTIVYEQNQLILLFVVLFLVSLINVLILPSEQKVKSLVNTRLHLSFLQLLVMYLVAFIIDIHFRGGIQNTLSARHFRDQNTISIFAIFSTSLLFVSLWLAAVRLKSESRIKQCVGFLLLALPISIIYNPFNAARFGIIQAWLPLVLIIWPRLLRFVIFAGSIAFGIGVVMPILSLTTRYGSAADISAIELDASSFLEFFDQHTVSLHLLDMVDRNGHQFGASTLSVIGFFIPRAIWPGKPDVVGLQVGNELYSDKFVGTPNLSGPIFLDFYLDYGIIGIIVGSVLTAYLLRYVMERGGRVNGVPLVEYIVLAALPIVARGSVGAVIGLVFFSLVFYYLIVHWSARIVLKPDPKAISNDVLLGSSLTKQPPIRIRK